MAASKAKQGRKSAVKAKKNDELGVNDKLNEFVQKNRKGLVLGLIAIVVILIGFGVGFSLKEKIATESFSKLDAFGQRYDDLKAYIGSEEPDAVAKQTDIGALLDDLAAFEKKTTGFAAAKAYSISADIYAGEKKWAEAGDAWSASAKAAAKTYLAPVSVFNAAVAAEEQGNTQSAIDLYTQALNYGDSFPDAARAQFAIGRLQESNSNKDAAIEAYKNLVAKWPYDPLWANLAQSRMMVLSE